DALCRCRGTTPPDDRAEPARDRDNAKPAAHPHPADGQQGERSALLPAAWPRTRKTESDEAYDVLPKPADQAIFLGNPFLRAKADRTAGAFVQIIHRAFERAVSQITVHETARPAIVLAGLGDERLDEPGGHHRDRLDLFLRFDPLHLIHFTDQDRLRDGECAAEI